MLSDKLKAEQAKIDATRHVMVKFPDLEEQRDRWGNIRLCSRTANALVNKVSYRHTCGCCSDSPLQAWMYLVSDGVEVYSNPPALRIMGREAWRDGEYHLLGWEEDAIKYGINPVVIEELKKYTAGALPKKDTEEP